MKQVLAVGLVLSAFALPVAAQDAPPNYGVAAGSVIKTDDARDGDSGIGWHLIYGSPVTDWLAVELNGYGHQAERDSDDEYDYTYGAGLDLRFGRTGSLFGAFALAGVGATYEDLPGIEETSPYANLGGGVLLRLPAPDLYLRLDARYYAIFNDQFYPGEDVLFDARGNVGLQYAFGAPPERTLAPAPERDSDGDGVVDSRDRCPGTPAGTPVDASGCPFDGDDDGDGVPNSLDACPGTPPGTLVDARGCPAAVPLAPVDGDADGDGVPDSRDRCPGTRPGQVVDPEGCPVDEDEDGVLNERDECPNTPRGLTVNDKGCVDRPQTTVLRNVNFEFDSARLTREARIVLDSVAAGLKGQPTMQVEIAGHCDGLGTQDYNLQLSKERAASVRAFLIDRGIDPARLRAEGYGEFEPVAENETEEGRAENRRVEFRVLQQ